MSESAIGSVVRPEHRFDAAALACYLDGRLPGFHGDVEISQFKGGQSNPTFRLNSSAGAYVLRKKPGGSLLPSAHAIEREFAVMRALHGLIPVPETHVFCDDPDVIGQPFYVMELIDGRVLPDARMLDAAKEERSALCLEMVRVLARLHKVDYRAVGLEDFGRTEGYIARQLARWSKAYTTARPEDNPDMVRLIGWLEDNLPDGDETTIIHGDYRSHNILFARDEPRVTAVLDWELATLGHPLADLAYCCLPYHLPADDLRGFAGATPESLGIPSEDEMIAAYCHETGRSELPDWHYFLVFSLFRSAAIRAGVFKRALDGNANDANALSAGQAYRGTAARAWQLAQSRAAA